MLPLVSPVAMVEFPSGETPTLGSGVDNMAFKCLADGSSWDIPGTQHSSSLHCPAMLVIPPHNHSHSLPCLCTQAGGVDPVRINWFIFPFTTPISFFMPFSSLLMFIRCNKT